jgi:hypothetical protein
MRREGMRWTQEEEFVIGANLPWLSYGGDFGANAWQPDGGVGRSGRLEVLRAELGRLSALGVSALRWFMLCDGRAGLRESASGMPEGLDGFVFRDTDAAVEALDRAGLRAVFVLFDFHWFKPASVVNGVQTCGRALLASDPGLRAHLLDRVVAPLLERYGRHPSIAAWDVVNEPEWVIRRRGVPAPGGGVPRSAMRSFIRDVIDLIHERTSHAATVGSASTRTLPLVRDLGLDLYQAHWYDHLDRRAPLDRPVSELGLDRPIILGEFPTRGSTRSAQEILGAAHRAGYAGALGWSALASDTASDYDALASALGEFSAGTASRPVLT